MKRAAIIFLCVLFAMDTVQAPLVLAQAQPAAQSSAGQSTPFKPEELEQIAAPIALYPDALLAQILMASTYPLEIVEAARWSKEHPDVKGDAVSAAVESQTWDPAVKSLVAFPQVLTMMNEKIDWTQKLGDAFLGQQKEVMDAVQRLRTKAKNAGNLKSGNEQVVKTEPATNGSTTQTIIIEQKDPQVVYVPTYDPAVVYGAWPYPAYPPYYYYPPGYVAGAAFWSFTAGVIIGGALWGGCNWGGGSVNINVNKYNNFNRNTSINGGNRNQINGGGNRGGNSEWKHNAEHRKGVGYRDSATQQKFGRESNAAAAKSREQFRGRADQGRQDMAREGLGNQRDLSGNQIGTRDSPGRDSASRDFGGGGQSRDFGGGSASTREAGGSRGDRGGSSASSRDLGGGSSSRDFGGSQSRTSASPSRSRSSDAFGGAGSGSSARASSSRGGASRGGGGRGGGRR